MFFRIHKPFGQCQILILFAFQQFGNSFFHHFDLFLINCCSILDCLLTIFRQQILDQVSQLFGCQLVELSLLECFECLPDRLRIAILHPFDQIRKDILILVELVHNLLTNRLEILSDFRHQMVQRVIAVTYQVIHPGNSNLLSFWMVMPFLALFFRADVTESGVAVLRQTEGDDCLSMGFTLRSLFHNRKISLFFFIVYDDNLACLASKQHHFWRNLPTYKEF